MQTLSEDGPYSLLSPLGYQVGSCGYCKDKNSSCAFYLNVKKLQVEHYQTLVDTGWRRSGKILYKPDARLSCCPHYTIRLPVADFEARKDQRQAVNRWNRFVLGDDYSKEAAKKYPKSKTDKARHRTEFDLSSAIHEAEHGNVKTPPEPAHRFEVSLEPDRFTEEKYQLFENYQKHVHQDDDVSRSGFRRFLCDSPLTRTKREINGIEQMLGSYHHCYRLDGRLIAMGVLDLLPHCVSSVYLIYHSDVEQWSFGKLSALRETALAHDAGYDFYYMGYYIHSCAKMRYKNDYRPQYILDYEVNAWDPLDDEVKALLARQKYVSMSRERRQRKDAEALASSGSHSGSPQDDNGLDTAHASEPSESPPQKPPAPYSTPSEAATAYMSGTSLFKIGLPGMLSLAATEAAIDLAGVRIGLRGKIYVAEMLVGWDADDALDPLSVKGSIAEMAACLGHEVMDGTVVVFGAGSG